MRKAWADPEHVGKITISTLNILTKEFHKEAKKTEIDYDLLVKLSQAAGYQCQLYSGLQKSHEFARRLQSIEKTLANATPEDLALGQSPALLADMEKDNKQSWR
jgi:hypothetical protein